MLNFSITTTTKLASLSICENEKTLGEINVEVSRTHSTTILDQIDKLFEWTGKKIENIENVIISIGPGSFTGVRIAIAVVKGLFFGKNVKIYEVNELDALAYQGYFVIENFVEIEKNIKIYSLIDSGKEKIYYGEYKYNKNTELLQLLEEYKIDKLDNFIEKILEKKSENDKLYFTGDAIFNYNRKIKEKLGNNVTLINSQNLKINATTFSLMLNKKILNEVDIYTLKPNYLEKSQAERDKKNGN